MEDGKIPNDWREAEVVPIFKKGSKADPGNYRPVSLTNVVGKTMERIVKEVIMRHEACGNSQHANGSPAWLSIKKVTTD